MKLVACLWLAIAIGTCQNGQTTSDQPVDPRPTPVPTDTQFCDAAQQNLQRLRCPEGNPTKRGESFGDVCRELQNDGIFVNPRCLATVKSCAEIDVCTGTSRTPN